MKHPWVELKIKGGNRERPLKVIVDTLFTEHLARRTIRLIIFSQSEQHSIKTYVTSQSQLTISMSVL